MTGTIIGRARCDRLCRVEQTRRAGFDTLVVRFDMTRVLLLTVVCAASLVRPVASAESPLSRYRDVSLGDPVQVVVDRLHVPMSDVKVVHDRPTVVQQLTWRPHRSVSGATVEPDPLAEMVLTFHLGRLARIAVSYDRARTAGLTDADLNEALTSTYGTSMLLSRRTTPALLIESSEPAPIGSWSDADTLVVLWRQSYPDRVRLTLTSVVDDLAMQAAIADGMRLETSEAPGRDLARRNAEAAAVLARAEAARRDNKATFKP